VANLMESRRYNSREAYAALVSRQIALGASVKETEVPVLVDYLFETFGEKKRQ
jgi:hypothetical protein